jgi:hypothetical protein
LIDLITVVFQEELHFLQTQARSIELYTRTQDICNIYVVVNDADSVADLVDPTWYGTHQAKVKIIPYSKWSSDPDFLNGWQRQQLCKLLAASEASSTWSMCLDAKTWFIQPLDLSKLFDEQQRVNSGSYAVHPEFTSSKQFLEHYYNISMPEIIGPAGPPFVFHSATVGELVNSFDDFMEFFKPNVANINAITEFHLYSSFVLARDGTYERLYNTTQYYNYYHLAECELDRFDIMYHGYMHDDRALTASIHRKAYPLLSIKQIRKWQKFLAQKGLNIDNILGVAK